jgi:hypothetical protein
MKEARSTAAVSVASQGYSAPRRSPGEARYAACLLRAASLFVYAGLAALGEALVARPALLFLRSLGLFHAVLPWRVPFGAVQLVLALALALLTVLLASRAALGKKSRLSLHAALLGLLALSFAARSTAAEPQAAADPLPSLILGLRTAAEALDQDYSQGYALDETPLETALGRLAAPGFVLRGRSLPLRARVLRDAPGPQLTKLAGDQPGLLYVAIASDRKSAWLTALSLNGIVRLASGRVAIIEAHGGTHSLAGRDPLIPAYPGMRSITDAKP